MQFVKINTNYRRAVLEKKRLRIVGEVFKLLAVSFLTGPTFSVYRLLLNVGIPLDEVMDLYSVCTLFPWL